MSLSPRGVRLPAPGPVADAVHDPELRRMLEGLGLAHGDRDPIQICDLKSRPGRRDSRFLGRCTRSPMGMIVRWGVVLKRSRPGRAAELQGLYDDLTSALGSGGELPAAPRVAAARPHAGWIALEAWPGVMMAGDLDPTRRERRAARLAQLIAALEGARRAQRSWPDRPWTAADEARRLHEVWEQAGEAMPDWSTELVERLAHTGLAMVPAHRDLNAEQVIVDPSAVDPEAGVHRWVDWDQAARAPAGLDLGNLLAHERLAALLTHGVAGVDYASLRWGAIAAYVEAGGRATEPALGAWEAAACLRLAGLSLQRARGDDGVTRNPDWLPAPSARCSEAAALRRAAEGVFAAAGAVR